MSELIGSVSRFTQGLQLEDNYVISDILTVLQGKSNYYSLTSTSVSNSKRAGYRDIPDQLRTNYRQFRSKYL